MGSLGDSVCLGPDVPSRDHAPTASQDVGVRPNPFKSAMAYLRARLVLSHGDSLPPHTREGSQKSSHMI